MSPREAVDHLGRPIENDDTLFNSLLLVIGLIAIVLIYIVPSPEVFGL